MFWKTYFYCEAEHAPVFDSILEEHVAAISCFETARPHEWIIECTTSEPPDKNFFRILLEPACASLHIAIPDMVIEKLPDTDWLAATSDNFPPRQIGRYYIHGSHARPCPVEGVINIEINAATAFGSGEHETTSSCLAVLDSLANEGKRFFKPLDMGCGSGILAIAMAKTWKCTVKAVDNDPEAVRVTRQNSLLNRCASHIGVQENNGFDNSHDHHFKLHDIITANILANPLIEMASALSHALMPKGTVVLSGLLTDQAETVIQAYNQQDVTLVSRHALNNWETLLLQKT